MHRTLCALLIFFAYGCADAASEPVAASPTGGETATDEARSDEAPSDEAPSDEAPAGGCARVGCSGQLCVPAGEERMTTCEFRAEYACYRDARCERQPDGSCGFTPTAELSTCLANPPAP